MSAWGFFIDDVRQHVSNLEEEGCDCPFFRGHAQENWNLVCGLGRCDPDKFTKKNIESILYYDFLSQAGPLLDRPSSSWDTLFSMQHHGLPTRLLDWSATFAVGLYFALKPYIAAAAVVPGVFDGSSFSPTIWVLNPFELNKHALGEEVILNPEFDLVQDYYEAFVKCETPQPYGAIAVNPTQAGRRLAAQRGCFTLHQDVFTPLNAEPTPYLRKFVLPSAAIPDAVDFLRLAGMHEYSLFPDLDGLARHLKALHVDWV